MSESEIKEDFAAHKGFSAFSLFLLLTLFSVAAAVFALYFHGSVGAFSYILWPGLCAKTGYNHGVRIGAVGWHKIGWAVLVATFAAGIMGMSGELLAGYITR